MYPALTELQIELRVEKSIDKLDRKLISGEIDQKDYDYEVYKIDVWASQQYEHSKNMGVLA